MGERAELCGWASSNREERWVGKPIMGFRTLVDVNDQLPLSAENKKSFGCPKTCSQATEKQRGKDG